MKGCTQDIACFKVFRDGRANSIDKSGQRNKVSIVTIKGK